MSYAEAPAKGDTVTVDAPEAAKSDVYFDPYRVDINADPYPTFRRLRAESPLYYNAAHDFYALSRFADVNKALVDHETFSSARGCDHRTHQGQHRDPARHGHFRGPADP
jgi:cytochrome P450